MFDVNKVAVVIRMIALALLIENHLLAAGSAYPVPYDSEVDSNTVALWHFDEPAGDGSFGLDQFEDMTGNFTLHKYGSAVINTTHVSRELGRAVQGFGHNTGLEIISHDLDHQSQTFEFWIQWNEVDALPQNSDSIQYLVSKLVSSSLPYGTSVQVYFDDDGNLTFELTLDGVPESLIHTFDEDPIKIKTLYHFAYTIEVGDFDREGDLHDTRAKIFWNDENNVDVTPEACSEKTFEDRQFVGGGWRIRVGKRLVTANEWFRGVIAEARYSDMARVDFQTFSLAAGGSGRYLGENSFKMFEHFRGVGKPSNLLSDYGISRLVRIEHWLLWPSPTNPVDDFPNESFTRASASALPEKPSYPKPVYSPPDNPIYFMGDDLVVRRPDGDVALETTTRFWNEKEKWDDYIQKRAAVCDWIHSQRPDIRLGIYRILPGREYDTPVKYEEDGPGDDKRIWDMWKERNDHFKALARHVDVVFPSLYTLHQNDEENWVKYAKANLKEARKYSKPIYVFLWPQFISSQKNPSGTLVPGSYWRLQLETCYRYADGIVIWSGGNTSWDSIADDTDPNNWWYQTVDFIKEKNLLPAKPDKTVKVTSRCIIYHRSAFDDAGKGLSDDAIAIGKKPLLPGRTATFDSYSSYSRGINGLAVDIQNTANPLELSEADFEFRVGNDNTPEDWDPVDAQPSVTVRPKAGVAKSDRVVICWPDNAIENQWLQVTVKATRNTGLTQDDVFYFGNAIGETGNRSGDVVVNIFDVIAVHDHIQSRLEGSVEIYNRFDFNRDRQVDVFDIIIARDSHTDSHTALELIEVPKIQAAGVAPATIQTAPVAEGVGSSSERNQIENSQSVDVNVSQPVDERRRNRRRAAVRFGQRPVLNRLAGQAKRVIRQTVDPERFSIPRSNAKAP